jgi:hypothetical protein
VPIERADSLHVEERTLRKGSGGRPEVVQAPVLCHDEPLTLAGAHFARSPCDPGGGLRSQAGSFGERKREGDLLRAKHRRGKTVEKKYTPPKKLLSAPEPAGSPPLQEEPAGEVIKLRSGPEGVVADPETGLVAVGLRNPDELALVDGGSGEVVRKVKLSGSPRHLGLAAPGGPVLVPAEPSDSLIQVGLPEGKVTDETPVGNFPHNVAAAPGGRIFVVSEAASTASVVENGKVIETIKTPLNPGGVAVTKSDLVGIVGVKGLALEVYDADTLDSVDIIDAGRGPTHVVAGPGNHFYVADTRGDALIVYETHPELEQVDRVPLSGGLLTASP